MKSKIFSSLPMKIWSNYQINNILFHLRKKQIPTLVKVKILFLHTLI